MGGLWLGARRRQWLRRKAKDNYNNIKKKEEKKIAFLCMREGADANLHK